jgi:hypothetical protein
MLTVTNALAYLLQSIRPARSYLLIHHVLQAYFRSPNRCASNLLPYPQPICLLRLDLDGRTASRQHPNLSSFTAQFLYICLSMSTMLDTA